jgi:hypothetical protein
MKVSGILLFIFILSGFYAPRCEATVYHSNGSAANVQQIHNTLAVDGDTIMIPAGRFSWTTHVTITKGITIQGQTTTNSDTGVCNDQTVLLDNLNPNYPGGEGYFHCRVNTGQSLRITGLTFTAGTTTSKYNGAIRVSGNSNQVRLDHLHFTNLYHTNYIAIYGTVRGVSDHVVEDHIPGQLGQNRVFNGAGAGGYGDEVWAQPAGYGGPDFFFFEDWYCDNSAGAPFSANGGWDANTGGKFVIRHCHLYNIEILCHGTEGSRARGGRAQEIYNNDYHWSYSTGMDGIRSGTLVVHDNTYDGIEPRGYGLQTYRMIHGYDGTWQGATGANPWDHNVTEPDGVTHIDGHPPYLFQRGTVTSAVNGSHNPTYMKDSTKNWTTNQWYGYGLRRPSDGATWRIIYNNNNTLALYQWTDPCCIQNWNVGDTYEIHKVLQAIDQPGAGAGDLLTGANPTPRLLHQVREGCYSWNNVYTPNGHHINWSPSSPGLLEHRDYFSNTPMPGYTPYTYPHPLVTGAARATVIDFNGDGHLDYVLHKASTRQTGIWYLNNNFYIGGAFGPTLPAGWALEGLADFNRDSHPDYAFFAPNTGQTGIWYLSGPTFIGSAYGPSVPSGWALVGTRDFNGGGNPDYVLYKAGTRQTAIWYLNNNVFINGAYGPTLPPGWNLIGDADFNGDGHPDYALFNSSTRQTAIWYLSGPTLIGGAYGPTIPSGWILVAAADFNGDGHPDYLLYNAGSRQTAIWYLNNNVFVGGAFGPTLPAGWSLIAPY